MSKWKVAGVLWLVLCLVVVVMIVTSGPRVWHTDEDAPLEPLPQALEPDGSWEVWREATAALATDHGDLRGTIDDALDADEGPDLAGLRALRDRLTSRVADLPDPRAMGGFRIEAESLRGDGDTVMPANSMSAAESLVAIAYLRAADGDPEGAADALARAHRLGVLFEHSGPNLVAVMVGVSTQSLVLRHGRKLAARVPMGWLVTAAREAAALPSGVASGLQGDCLGLEEILVDLSNGKAEPDGPPVPTSLPPIFLPGRSVSLHRYRCRQLITQALLPPDERQEIEFPKLWRPVDPRTWLDNPGGRILLDMSAPNYLRMAERRDALMTRLAELEDAIREAPPAAATAPGADPATPVDAAPPADPAPPVDPAAE